MRILFISCSPHRVHKEFAKSINAKTKIVPFQIFFELEKKFKFLGLIFPLIALIYSFFIKVEEDVLFVEGSGILYIGAFLKIKKPTLKIIYLDADTAFFDIVKYKKNPFLFKIPLKTIDGIISVSERNKEYSSKYVKAPIKVALPFPKNVKKEKIKRKNFGIYVGRLDPDKEIKKVIKFALQCPYFEKFIILGDGVYKNYVKKISRKYSKIDYLGYKENLDRYYSVCKFLIHLTDADTFPCTVMEAALCGCYPIISKKVGVSKIFNKIFLLENPDNFDEINNKIEYILKNEKKARELLKKSSSEIPDKKTSISNFQSKFNELLKELSF